MNRFGGDRWEEVEPLLDQLLDSEPDSRSQMLVRIRSGDPNLAAEAERMLHAIGESERYLQEAAADYASPLISELAGKYRLPAGTCLGGYKITGYLGQGGSARVYLGHDRKHDRRVAIKVPHPELAAALGAERFLREIRIAAQLQHPYIVPLHDSGESDGVLYYVMPYIEGESLRDRLKRETRLPPAAALQIAAEVAEALGHSHARGFVHRDIKPENILLTAGGHAMVADFGIARAIAGMGRDQLTETGIIIGTPEYMSPEQASGESQLDGRSDIYSLGCVVYEMLLGEPPFTGEILGELFARKLVDPVPSMRIAGQSLPIAVERAVNRALAVMPADRFALVQQFASALRGESPAAAASDRLLPPAGAIRRQLAKCVSWLETALAKNR